MQIAVLFGVLACFNLARVGMADLSGTIDGIIDNIVIKIQRSLAEYDPLTVNDRSFTLFTGETGSIKSFYAGGFSKFEIQDDETVGEDVTVTCTFPEISVNVDSFVLGGKKGFAIPHLGASVEGLMVGVNLKYISRPFRLTQLDITLQYIEYSFKGEYKLKGKTTNIVPNEELVQAVINFGATCIEKIKAFILTVCNSILESIFP